MTLGNELLRYKKDQLYLIFDKETEGLNYYYSRPYQISFILCTLDEIKEKHDYYIWWPDLKMSEGAKIKTKFNYDLYKERAQDPKKIYDIFTPYLKNKDVIPAGHNILGYDNMIYANCWSRNVGYPMGDFDFQERAIDTNILSKAHLKGMKPDMANFLAWQFKIDGLIEKKFYSNLAIMAAHFKIPLEEERLHEALYDVVINYEVLKKLIWTMDI